MHNEKAYPYPEIVTGESWEVIGTLHDSSEAKTDNLNRQMTVPLNRDCQDCGINHSRYIRRHELGHAKWSPKTMGKLKPGVRAEAIEVLEEVRINHLLYENKLPIQEPIMCLDALKLKAIKLMYEGSLSSIILMGLASIWRIDGTSETSRYSYSFSAENELIIDAMDAIRKDPTVTELRKSEIEYANRVIQQYYRNIINHSYGITISYRKVQKYAVELSKILDMFRDKPNPDEVYKQPAEHTAPGMDESESESQTEEDETLDDETVQQRSNRELKQMIYSSTGGVGQWGEMKIHTPPLTVNLQGRIKGGRNYRPADFGYNPKYINRFCVDKKIFKQKIRTLGGTILIDASGSMDFYGDDILQIMQLLPAVNIAMYNGRATTGDLRIIARNGMRVNDTYLEEHSGYGNVVDGPALEWLGTQPERRIWVSDMMVFGAYGDSSGFNLLQDVYKSCKKFNIINLKNIEEVKEHALKLNM